MSFTLGLLLGVVVGAGLLVWSFRSPAKEWPRWTALVLGATGALLFTVGVLGLLDNAFAIIPSLALPFAGMVFAVGRVVRGDRFWQSWLGLALAAIPGLFWIAFAIGEVLFPH